METLKVGSKVKLKRYTVTVVAVTTSSSPKELPEQALVEHEGGGREILPLSYLQEQGVVEGGALWPGIPSSPSLW